MRESPIGMERATLFEHDTGAATNEMDPGHLGILPIDSAVCWLRNGEIFVATQQEHFTRKKHEQSCCWQHQLGPVETLPGEAEPLDVVSMRQL